MNTHHKPPIYPDDWPAIALACKRATNFHCERCGLHWKANPNNSLGVHHRDYNPQNNHPSNLQVLCSPCHLRQQAADIKAHRTSQPQLSNILHGQLSLPLGLPDKLPFSLH